jgi:hypothetical protein
MISNIVSQLESIREEIISIKDGVTDFWDLDLEDTLVLCMAKLSRDIAGLKRWNDIAPSTISELCPWHGLLRDCRVVPVMKLHDPIDRLTPKQLEHPLIRAAYMASTAYLEITSIDIVSDLIVQTLRVYSLEGWPLVEELAMQLLDECRHAELLAAHVQKMGYPVYVMPIELESWEIYSKCETVTEKLAMQQILQESLGLEASASNVVVMEEIGDFEAADIYAQLAADECNHVKLGMKWVNKYEIEVESFIEKIRNKIGETGIEISIPLVKELRRICGWSEASIAREASQRRELALSKIHAAISRGQAE